VLLSAQNIEKIYVDMPDVLNPVLSKQNRLELLEYHKAGQGDSVLNRFGKQSHLVTLDTLNNLLVIKNTASSIFELKIFRWNENEKVFGIIRTLCAPVCHSTVEFYNSGWNSISMQFSAPKTIQWLNEKKISESAIDVVWVKNVLNNNFIELSFSRENDAIIAQNNTLQFLSENERKQISPLLNHKPITFWLINREWKMEQ
jgi:hypothetical protein